MRERNEGGYRKGTSVDQSPIGSDPDIVIVGGGNAGFCAAHAAREEGARVLLLEKGSADQAGGNSYYTAGAFRVVHDGLQDLTELTVDQRQAGFDQTVLPAYTDSDFVSDMRRITDGRNDPGMTAILVSQSRPTVEWLANKGLRWRLMYERQAYRSNGQWVFFGGLALGTEDGGRGLIAQHTAAATQHGVEVRYGATVNKLLQTSAGVVTGVRYADEEGHDHVVHASAVILAAGGFEADPARRHKHLGKGWEHALIRGNPLNTGEVLDLAIQAGASPFGDWSSCHSVAWDAGAPPDGGDRNLTNQLTRGSYPLGVVVNRLGRRFIDEGADYRNYTYARYGREILAQPDGVAFQLFDAKTRGLLRPEEYDSTPITMACADSLEELAQKLGIDPIELRATIGEFNASIEDRSFDPAVRDGRAARVKPPKSNWALALDTPPYYGFAVSCGITFTFGGVRVDDCSCVLDTADSCIPGLYAAGELVGGLFSGNYPGGTGLTAGAVFGRRAGQAAGSRSLADHPAAP